MRVGHADLRIGHAAVLAAQHEGDDAREIALIRQHLQVEHQLHVLVAAGRDARGMIDERQLLIALLLGHLDAPLDVANRVEILGRASCDRLRPSAPCRCATSSLTESSTLRCCRIRASRTFGSVLPLSPNSRSNTARGLFCVGSGVFALCQRDRVGVGAGEARCRRRPPSRRTRSPARATPAASACPSPARGSDPSRCRHRARSRSSAARRRSGTACWLSRARRPGARASERSPARSARAAARGTAPARSASA